MPFFTQILSKTTPKSIYCVVDEFIYLIPAGTVDWSTDEGISILYNAINFYTNSKSKEEHVNELRRFCIIYSFLFEDEPIYMFDRFELTDHKEIDSIGMVPLNNHSQMNKLDFDNVLRQVYFMEDIMEIKSFRELYRSTEVDHLSYFTLYLDHFGIKGPQILRNDYVVFNHTYHKIINCVTILEIIIGHNETCEEYIQECKSCGKTSIRHRKGSEGSWINEYLTRTIKDQSIVREYFRIIDFAKGIRNRTVHQGKLPTAKHILQGTEYEEFGFDRSSNEYKDNNSALLSVDLAVRSVTRALMLNYFFKLNSFFPVKKLKVATFKFSSEGEIGPLAQ